ncbi:MAG: AlpA family phage regulatory protein [Alphaproteobacteria bacterium]|nr:AlpA family phage regulatory protein [Alphaproteobacteria bacterium]
MRLIDKKKLREMVLYSPQHIQRLEDAGRFPRRVRLGQGRVGWIEQEVLDWLQQRIGEREKPADSSP